MPGRALRQVGTLILVLGLAAAVAPARAATPLPLLDHHGRWLTDPQGRVVILHGLQVDRFKPGSVVEYIDLSPENVRFIGAQGFNAARVSMAYSGVEPSLGQFDEQYINSYRSFDAQLASAGVYDLLDMMQGEYSAEVGGWGFPDWMTNTSGLPNTNEPFPRGYLDNPAEQAAWDNFWANARASDGVGFQDHYAAGLRHLGAAFATAPGLLGFEILNEPWPGSRWPLCASPLGCLPGGFDQTSFTDFYKRVIPALRSADPTHLILYEPNLLFDFGAATNLGTIPDPNLAFAFHNYCLGAAPGFPQLPDLIGACGINEQIVLNNAEARAAASGDGLLMDEWGNSADRALIARVAAEADQQMVGWTEWAYEDCCNSPAAIVKDGTKPPSGDNVNLPVLTQLVRAYPQAVAGTPTGWSYNPGSKRFELTFSTQPVGSRAFDPGTVTRIEVPPLQYPTGYDVVTEGARVISAPDADPLLVRALVGATAVRVTVTPADHHPAAGGIPGSAAEAPGKCITRPRPRLRSRRGLGPVVTAKLYVSGRRVGTIRGRRARRPMLPAGLTNGTRIRVVATTSRGVKLMTRGSIQRCRFKARRTRIVG